MKNRSWRILPLISLLILAVVIPANGTINTISSGGTVFIGEQNLDITSVMDGDTKVGWWASAASLSESSPSNTVQISTPSSFSISPSVFGSYPGTWYRLNASGVVNGSAFTVMDPTLEIRVEDTTVNVDVTNKWVPTDDEIRFRIDTNLLPIASRSGMSSVPITIKVKDPAGGIYSSLINSAGTSTSIVDYPVSGSPFYTPSIWDTGQRATYPVGTYTIWAECNANLMKDNYEYAGKTVSSKVSLQNQDHNPLITGNYPATTTTNVAVVTPTRTTRAPVTTLPATTTIPTTVITTPAPSAPVTTIPVTTEVPATAVPKTTAQPTKSPGFESAVLILALCCCILVFTQRR